MTEERLFIYIASLRRTGSTVISEALTSLPHCFIFREPRLSQGRFKIKPSDIELFRERGVDLDRFRQLRAGEDAPSLLRAFREELLPQLKRHIWHVGVKEIVHDAWRTYYETFPEMKIVLTARDPRGIYISLHDRAQRGRGRFAEDLSPMPSPNI